MDLFEFKISFLTAFNNARAVKALCSKLYDEHCIHIDVRQDSGVWKAELRPGDDRVFFAESSSPGLAAHDVISAFKSAT